SRFDQQCRLGSERSFAGVHTFGSGLSTNLWGIGDTFARSKINLWGNDGGDTAAAIIPYVKAFPRQNRHFTGGSATLRHSPIQSPTDDRKITREKGQRRRKRKKKKPKQNKNKKKGAEAPSLFNPGPPYTSQYGKKH